MQGLIHTAWNPFCNFRQTLEHCNVDLLCVWRLVFLPRLPRAKHLHRLLQCFITAPWLSSFNFKSGAEMGKENVGLCVCIRLWVCTLLLEKRGCCLALFCITRTHCSCLQQNMTKEPRPWILKSHKPCERRGTWSLLICLPCWLLLSMHLSTVWLALSLASTP